MNNDAPIRDLPSWFSENQHFLNNYENSMKNYIHLLLYRSHVSQITDTDIKLCRNNDRLPTQLLLHPYLCTQYCSIYIYIILVHLYAIGLCCNM